MPANPVETVEAIASFARRTNGGVRLVLHLPAGEATDGADAQVRLTGKRGAVSANATITAADPGLRVQTDIPAKKVPPGIWRIAVRFDPEMPFRRVRARLLTSRTQPIALLPGPASRTQIDPPHRMAHGNRPRVVQRAGHVVDLALKRLPEERAQRYRSALRRSARRMLG